MGLGTVGGFKLQIEDRGAVGYAQLDAAAQAFMAAVRKAPELGPAFSSFQINVPQMDVDLDRVKAKQLGVPVTDVFDTMQIFLGCLYIYDFNRFGRVYQYWQCVLLGKSCLVCVDYGGGRSLKKKNT